MLGGQLALLRAKFCNKLGEQMARLKFSAYSSASASE